MTIAILLNISADYYSRYCFRNLAKKALSKTTLTLLISFPNNLYYYKLLQFCHILIFAALLADIYICLAANSIHRKN